jgi:hypothetical protein
MIRRIREWFHGPVPVYHIWFGIRTIGWSLLRLERVCTGRSGVINVYYGIKILRFRVWFCFIRRSPPDVMLPVDNDGEENDQNEPDFILMP